ncbi:unnamed protein product [Rotaria sordida]|uniref:Uncharacterized protein n=1 Tax=Rotaria sordida TaxID=392033 RepID=A0A815TVL2_9BILA|nr:unnamed protein product [Rotaria sordida]
MSEISSAMSTLEWLNDFASNNSSLRHENENISATSSTSDEIIEITPEVQNEDNSGEITVVCFNLSCRIIEPLIEKDKSYEINNLCIKTANDTYKTLPNRFQLTSTTKTTITEIMDFHIMPIEYQFLKLEDLATTPLDSVIGKETIPNTIFKIT